MAKAKKKTAASDSGDRTITVNRKAFHDYEILEKYEAGLALTGTEIKSVRAGRVELRDAYARPQNGELWLVNAHIAHDCQIGDYTAIVNNVMLDGHVTVEDRVYLGGAAGIHQFCRIGKLATVCLRMGGHKLPSEALYAQWGAWRKKGG